MLIRVPRLLRDVMVGLLSGCDDMELVGEGVPALEPGESVRRYRPDVLVLAENGEATRMEHRMLEAHPALKIFVLAGEGRSVSLVELAPRRVALGQVSPGELLEAIRASVSRHRAGTVRPPG